MNTVKQAHAFGIVQQGQKQTGLLVFITNIKSLGLDIAQGLQFTTAFYWDRNDASRQWSNRFLDKQGAIPTMQQAGTYSAVTIYLKAIKAAGTDDADAVRAQLGKMTINDFVIQNGHIKPNGLTRHDLYLVRVKKPSESKGPWDLLEVVSTIPADKAYIPLSESNCPFVSRCRRRAVARMKLSRRALQPQSGFQRRESAP